MTASRRPAVHQDGRARTLRAPAAGRTTSISLILGKTTLGCQLSMSTTQTPVISTRQPSLRVSRASGHELKSTGRRNPSLSRTI